MPRQELRDNSQDPEDVGAKHLLPQAGAQAAGGTTSAARA